MRRSASPMMSGSSTGAEMQVGGIVGRIGGGSPGSCGVLSNWNAEPLNLSSTPAAPSTFELVYGTTNEWQTWLTDGEDNGFSLYVPYNSGQWEVGFCGTLEFVPTDNIPEPPDPWWFSIAAAFVPLDADGAQIGSGLPLGPLAWLHGQVDADGYAYGDAFAGSIQWLRNIHLTNLIRTDIEGYIVGGQWVRVGLLVFYSAVTNAAGLTGDVTFHAEAPTNGHPAAYLLARQMCGRVSQPVPPPPPPP